MRVEGAEQAAETIIRAVEAERREPQPVWPRLRGIADDEEFEVLLIETLGVLDPAAQGAAAWLVNDLDRFDPLDLTEIRSPSRARMLEAILVALRGIGPVPETINALRSPRRLTRTIAAMALSENADLAPRIAPILVDSLGDEWRLLGLCFNDVFRKDIGCLKKMGHRAVPALLSAIRENRNLDLAASSLAGMKSDSERVVPLLAAVVNSKQERTEVRAAVARALGFVGVDDAATARLLTKVLRDSGEHETLRVAAVNGLGLSRVPGTEAVLHEFERDESKAIRVAVEKEFQFRRKQE